MDSIAAALLLIATLGAGLAQGMERAHAHSRCDRWAAPWGHDRWRGTHRRPVRRLATLARRLRPGRVGCLRRGRYGTRRDEVDLRRHHGTTVGRVVLRSAPGGAATIVGLVVVKGDGITLSRLRFDGDNDLGAGGLAQPLIVDGSRDTIERSTYTNHRRGTGILLRKGTGAVVRDNRIHDVGAHFGYDHGIYVAHAQRFTITGNWIYHCPAGWGIQLYPAAAGGVIARNVIDRCGGGVIFAGDGAEASHDNVFTRNVISRSLGLGRFNPGSAVAGFHEGPLPEGNLVLRNVFWANPGGPFAPPGADEFTARRNVELAPRFVAASRHDYRLLPGPALTFLRQATRGP
jgi:Right handed beta helix region